MDSFLSHCREIQKRWLRTSQRLREKRKNSKGTLAHGETCKLHHQLPNEGSLNRSSGTHNHSSHCCASAAGLRSTTPNGHWWSTLSQCPSYTTGCFPVSKPHHHVKTHRVQQSKPSEGIKCHRTGPLRYWQFFMLCFLMCEYPESQPRDRGGKKSILKVSPLITILSHACGVAD